MLAALSGLADSPARKATTSCLAASPCITRSRKPWNSTWLGSVVPLISCRKNMLLISFHGSSSGDKIENCPDRIQVLWDHRLWLDGDPQFLFQECYDFQETQRVNNSGIYQIQVVRNVLSFCVPQKLVGDKSGDHFTQIHSSYLLQEWVSWQTPAARSEPGDTCQLFLYRPLAVP